MSEASSGTKHLLSLGVFFPLTAVQLLYHMISRILVVAWLNNVNTCLAGLATLWFTVDPGVKMTTKCSETNKNVVTA